MPAGSISGRLDAGSFEPAAGSPEAGFDDRRRPPLARVRDLAASADGARLYAIAGSTLCGYDLSVKQITSCSSLSITPGSFQPMPGGILLLNYVRGGNTPLWLLDAASGQIYFVPTGNTAANASF